MRYLIPLPVLLASPVWAKSFDRPIPQAQSATAEFWFLIGSVGLIAALAAVQWMVSRR